MSKHTPGPWEVNIDAIGDIFISGANSEYVAEIGSSEDKAAMNDANLIAAAPELLEALKYFLDVYEQEEWVSNEIGYAADIALAAIAKAEGTDQ